MARESPLFGSFEVDREGVLPKKLHLVENGTLKGYLLTRQPVRGIEGSNGHARLPGSYGALHRRYPVIARQCFDYFAGFGSPPKADGVDRDAGQALCIVVREMDFPSSMSVEDARRMLAGVPSGSSYPVSLPILVYRVYADGREELVRGMAFRGFTARSLKDIPRRGRRPQSLRFSGQPGSVRAYGCWQLRIQCHRGGALDPGRRPGTTPVGGGTTEAAGGSRSGVGQVAWG